MNILSQWKNIKESLPEQVELVAVSKTHPAEKIKALYEVGQRKFGENKVQELSQKAQVLPRDIEWHLIGHLQRNKVSETLEYAYIIESVDSERLLKEINKEAAKIGKIQKILLQVKIAKEETKYGLSKEELELILKQIKENQYPHVHLIGLMGMASFTEDEEQVQEEFSYLKKIFDTYQKEFSLQTLSMGMSGDFPLAISLSLIHI